ncbi:hypothetical protein CTYAZ2_09960 [Comamonas testosteroni]|nr:hypothetical protein CTYAZ2_09960 [Comamonas testosteroni]
MTVARHWSCSLPPGLPLGGFGNAKPGVRGLPCVPITVGQKPATAIHPIASRGGVQYSCHAGIGYAWFELSMSLTMGNERGKGSGQLSQREKPGNFRFMAWWLHSRGQLGVGKLRC